MFNDAISFTLGKDSLQFVSTHRSRLAFSFSCNMALFVVV